MNGTMTNSVDVLAARCTQSSGSANNVQPSTSVFVSAIAPSIHVAVSKQIWHSRLGHPSVKTLESC